MATKAAVDVKKLFKAYEDLLKIEEATALELEQTKKDKSAAIKAIFDACGKGPYDYTGKLLLIVARGETFFFKDVSPKPKSAPKPRTPKAKKAQV